MCKLVSLMLKAGDIEYFFKKHQFRNQPTFASKK